MQEPALSLEPPADSTHAQALRLLKDDPLFGRCTYTSLARLLPHVALRDVAAGERLWQAGDAAEGLCLLSGLDARLTAPSGRTLVLTYPRCGEECASQTPAYLATVQAHSAGQLLHLPRAALDGLLSANPWLRAELLLSLSSQLTGEALAAPEPTAATPTAVSAQRPVPRHKLLGWVLTLVLPLWLLASAGAIGQALAVEPAVPVFLAIFLATVLMWVFSLIDDYIPALFALLATLITGLVPAPVIVSGFGSNGFLMAMSTLALGTVVVSSGLSYRCMLWLLSRLPQGPFWHNAGLFLAGAALTPILPTANGRIALVAPFLQDMADSLRLQVQGSAATRLASSAFAGIGLLSATVMTAKSVNFAVYGLLPVQEQDRFQWLTWLLSAAVAGAVLCASYAVLALLWFRNTERPTLPRELIQAQRALLGRLKNREWAALAALGFVGVGVATSEWHKVQPPWLVLGMLLGLLLFGTLRRKEFKEQVDWTFLLYLSGVTGLVSAIAYLQIDQLIGRLLPGLGQLMSTQMEWFVLLLFVAIQLVRVAVPINATVVILAAILMPVAELSGVNPWVIGFMILLFAEAWFLPYQCSYYLPLGEANAERPLYNEASFLRFNAAMNCVRLLAVYASLPLWRAQGYL